MLTKPRAAAFIVPSPPATIANRASRALRSSHGLTSSGDGLSNLRELDLAQNELSSAAPLAALSGLTFLNLAENQVSSLEPFVKNTSYGLRGELFVVQNPLPCASEQESIDALEARGLDVVGDCVP